MADCEPAMKDHLIPQIVEAITEGYTELYAETLNLQVRDLHQEVFEVKDTVNRMRTELMDLTATVNRMHTEQSVLVTLINRILEIAEHSRDAQDLLEQDAQEQTEQEEESYTPISDEFAEQCREMPAPKRARWGTFDV